MLCRFPNPAGIGTTTSWCTSTTGSRPLIAKAITPAMVRSAGCIWRGLRRGPAGPSRPRNGAPQPAPGKPGDHDPPGFPFCFAFRGGWNGVAWGSKIRCVRLQLAQNREARERDPPRCSCNLCRGGFTFTGGAGMLPSWREKRPERLVPILGRPMPEEGRCLICWRRPPEPDLGGLCAACNPRPYVPPEPDKRTYDYGE